MQEIAARTEGRHTHLSRSQLNEKKRYVPLRFSTQLDLHRCREIYPTNLQEIAGMRSPRQSGLRGPYFWHLSYAKRSRSFYFCNGRLSSEDRMLDVRQNCAPIAKQILHDPYSIRFEKDWEGFLPWRFFNMISRIELEWQVTTSISVTTRAFGGPL